MKHIISIALCLAMLFSFSAALAAGDPNIDGGGGGLGGGTSKNFWYGDEGVRVTIVNVNSRSPVTQPIDIMRNPYYLQKWNNGKLYHFGKVCKLSYSDGTPLTPIMGGYDCTTAEQSLPKIIKTNTASSSIAALRSYFTDEQVLRSICNKSGFNYDTLISGDYRVLIEPLAHFLFKGKPYAMTATEAALYDEMINGDLSTWLGPLTHKNLPLALFLDAADMGYPAWAGSKVNRVSNAEIKSSLGLGIVRFTEKPDDNLDPEIKTYDYEYRVDTDVITSVVVSGGQSDPDNPTSVEFIIGGITYSVGNVFYPSGGSQLAWVHWHTPATPQDIVINVRIAGIGSTQSTINVKISEIDGTDPPNPVADDRSDGFTAVSEPIRPTVSSLSWGIWTPRWQENWVWVSNWCWVGDAKTAGWVDCGSWEDHGWWEFDYESYTANMNASMAIMSDEHNPTAYGDTIKSGYGFRHRVLTDVNTTQRSAVTGMQTGISYFPESHYITYRRILDCARNGIRAEFCFKPNEYSTFRSRIHFTPIWYPDGDYTVNTWVLDCWTPAGMLSANLSDSLKIQGNLWQDWHIAPKKP